MGKNGGESRGMAALAEEQEAQYLQTLRACPLARLAAAFAEENESQKPTRRKKAAKSTAPTVTVHKNAERRFKQCSVDGCIRYQRSKGLCKAHGGGRRCSVDGCPRSDQGGGFCIRHGGGARCQIDGCKNGAQRRGVCKSHGGGSADFTPKKAWREMMMTPNSNTSKSDELQDKPRQAAMSKAATTNELDGVKESGADTKALTGAVLTDAMESKACASADDDKVPDRLNAGETALPADPNANAVRPSVNNISLLHFVPAQHPVVRVMSTRSPHAVPSSPKPESVSPLAKACATPTRWPPQTSPGLSHRSSIKLTAAAPPSVDNASSCVSAAALLLSLQTGASSE